MFCRDSSAICPDCCGMSQSQPYPAGDAAGYFGAQAHKGEFAICGMRAPRRVVEKGFPAQLHQQQIAQVALFPCGTERKRRKGQAADRESRRLYRDREEKKWQQKEITMRFWA